MSWWSKLRARKQARETEREWRLKVVRAWFPIGLEFEYLGEILRVRGHLTPLFKSDPLIGVVADYLAKDGRFHTFRLSYLAAVALAEDNRDLFAPEVLDDKPPEG